MSENIVTALLKVQKDLKAPKNQFNSFGKYNYRNAEDILEAVKPLNADNGLLLTLKDEPILIGERYYIKATASITNGKETIETTAYARESQNKKGMDDSQVSGTASSYARKYALNGLYLIDDTKDADSDEYQNQNNQQKNQSTYNNNNQNKSTNKPKKATDNQLNLVSDLIRKNVDTYGKTWEEVYNGLKSKINNKNMEDFTPKEASDAITLLKSWLEKKDKQGA